MGNGVGPGSGKNKKKDVSEEKSNALLELADIAPAKNQITKDFFSEIRQQRS